MKTVTSLHFLKSKFLFLLIVFACTSCRGFNYPSNSGPVWFGEAKISTNPENFEASDKNNFFPIGTTTVYCSMSIQGPRHFVMPIRWYFEDSLVYEEMVDFGTERKVTISLDYSKGEPLPSGNYRCEFSLDPKKPNRFVNFRIDEAENMSDCSDSSKTQCVSPLVTPAQ